MAAGLSTVVCDCGSGFSKAGFAGASTPQAVFPSIVGRPRDEVTDEQACGIQKEFYVGEEANARREALFIKYPIQFSYITNWDDMEKLWQHMFNGVLHVSSEDHPVLLTEPPMNPKFNREKTTEIMFETFCTPAMYLAKQSVLSLLSSGGCLSGIVLESGDGFTFSVPVIDGNMFLNGTAKLPFAGRELTQYMLNLLNQGGNNFNTADWDIVRGIKEDMCYVTQDYKRELIEFESSNSSGKAYTLPDGKSINISRERFLCPEALFQPSLYGLEFGGIHELLKNSIDKCKATVNPLTLYKNIYLSGGSTMFSGLVKRLQNEMSDIAPPSAKVKITGLPERQNSCWKGGSIMACMSTFKEMCISKDEYDEHGPTLVHSKCAQ